MAHARLAVELASARHFIEGELRCGICGHRIQVTGSNAVGALSQMTAHVVEHLQDAVAQSSPAHTNGKRAHK